MSKETIRSEIEAQLKKRETPLRNKNAIEKLFSLIPQTDALYKVLFGINDVIEVERQKLTVDKILDLIIAIDQKINGDNTDHVDPGLKILIENVTASGDITGLEGNTSNVNVQKIFEKPLEVSIKNAYTTGSITGVKLNVDKEIQVRGRTIIQTDNATIEFNPDVGDITFGKGL